MRIDNTENRYPSGSELKELHEQVKMEDFFDLLDSKIPRPSYESRNNVADQAREMGIEVGDTIIGGEGYENNSGNEWRLTLLWIGESSCVWMASGRTYFNNKWGDWSEPKEVSNWVLNLRDWFREEKEEPPVKPRFDSKDDYLDWCSDQCQRIKTACICLRHDLVTETVAEIDQTLYLRDFQELYP